MQKINKSLKIIAVLFVLAAFWLFYFVLQFTYGSPENKNLSYIPTNAHVVVAFDANLTLKSVLSDFLSSKDEQLIGKLNDSRKELKQNSGIDVLSDFVLFSIDDKGIAVTGVLMNLTNERDFISYFSDQIIASNSSVGVLLFDEGNVSKKKNLQQYANSILRAENTIYTEKLIQFRDSESVISIWTKNGTGKKWNCANLKMIDSKITISGTAAVDNTYENQFLQLKPNNSSFHFSSNSFVPKHISDSLNSFLAMENNQLLGVSINYRSLKIEQETSFEVVPDADCIFQFEKNIDLPKLLANVQEKNVISGLTSEKYIYGKKTFYFKQLNATTFYLGRTPVNSIQSEKSASILSMEGAPKYLTKIEGSPFILRLLSIFPAFRVGKGFSTAIQTTNINVQSTTGNTVKINGEIEFQKGKYASIELIRNLLELR